MGNLGIQTISIILHLSICPSMIFFIVFFALKEGDSAKIIFFDGRTQLKINK
jgi:hypothetical protein